VLARFNILIGALLILLVLALAWRAFLYERPAAPVPVVPQAAPAATPEQAEQAATQADLILELFNPSDDALAQQISASTLKRQLEEAIILSFVLRRCEYLSAKEYRETYQAIYRYAESGALASSPSALQAQMQSIIASASDSYRLMYARQSCREPHLAVSARQLAQWRASLIEP
jgi:hypothetical protein